jgi:hypothetical protein
VTTTCSISAELNGVTIDGADEEATYVLLADSIGGLGLPEPRVADLERTDDHGTVAGVDYTTSRVLRIPIAIKAADDPEAAMVALRALKAAWKPTGPTDDVLSITLPGYGPSDDVVRFFGRPRTTLEVNLSRLGLGVVYALATFVALDPIGYGPTEVTAGSGTFTVTNAGDATSKRATIEVVGNGGTPVLVNNSDGGADVRFSQALGGGSSWFIDLATRTVVDGSGNDVFPSNVLAASLWPRLVPGSNSLTLTGAGSASVSHRSGWW